MALGRAGQHWVTVAAGVLLACVCVALVTSVPAAAVPGDYLESFGPDGTEGTGFGDPTSLGVDEASGAVYVGDSEEQAIYKFDVDGNPVDWGGSAPYISGAKISGMAFHTDEPDENQIAVDPQSHIIYVTSGDKVRAFEANGEPHIFSAGEASGTNEIPGAIRLNGVAVDSQGNIYASDFGLESVPGTNNESTWRIRVYSPTGALLLEFHPKRVPSNQSIEPKNVAVAPNGTLYVSTPHGVYRFSPSQFPVSPATTYSEGVPLDGNSSLSVAVDKTTSYVYISQFVVSGSSTTVRVGVYDDEGTFLGTIGAAGQPGELTGTPRGIAVNGGAKRLYVEAKGEPGVLAQVSVFEPFQFPVLPPEISGTSATQITSSSAELRAKINPHTLETTYWFEYGLEDCELAPGACTKVPADGASAGSGHKAVTVSVNISGLAPDTKYFYRVVAENALSVGPEGGPVRSFTTQVGHFDSSLIDGRAWEQVTPGNKFGGVPMNAALLQAGASGDGIAFHTRGSIVEDPESNRALEASAVLAHRGAGGGWAVQDLVPPHTEAGGLGFGPEFKLFSSDLGQAVFEPRDATPLSEEASERTPYLRTNTTPPAYRPLVTSKEGFENVSPGTVFGGEANGARNPVSISAANDSLTHVVLSSENPLIAGAANRSIYLWHDGELEPVSELPAVEGRDIVQGMPGSGTLTVLNSVSADGSRIFWSPRDLAAVVGALERPALYLRDTEADESVRLDVAEADATDTGTPSPAFMGASADGSVVFFTDAEQLTKGASPEGRDLYRCQIGDVGGSLGCTDIEDISAPLEGSGESSHVEELALGMSKDGSNVFFIARSVLDLQPNQLGDEAAAGELNLYEWRQGAVRFIATLSPGDSTDWGKSATGSQGLASKRTATASPNGRYLSFMSERNLAGDESDDPATGEPVEQVFLYDGAEESLACLSCDTSGGTDPGHFIPNDGEGGVILPDPQTLWRGRWVGALTPEPTEGEPTVGFVLYQPRAVLDNGRVFFNSAQPLVTNDSNGTWDVYQYEPFGLGTCDSAAASGMIALAEEGCVGLISSGTDDQSSIFMDASADGEDLFFATSAPLSALDNDDIPDVYDARVGGISPEPALQPQPCVGEACQPSSSPPADSPPNSAGFNGPGNVKSKPHKHCRKGQKKVHRKGKVKCVAKKKHHNKDGGGK